MEQIDKNDCEAGLHIPPSFSETEEMASYKLKTVLNHLNMSSFDYDIRKDTVYIRKDAMLLHDFTTHWFREDGDYYYLENLTGCLKDIIRSSFLDVTMRELEKVRHNVTGELINFDAPLVYKEGNSRWANFVLGTMLDDDGEPMYVIGYCKDIHDQKKELYRLRNVAQTDSLTGFRNRFSGFYRVQTKLAEETDATFFIAVIDLNKFKSANDLFGHSFGDLILKNVADRIRDYTHHETVCCRTGGDEFLFFGKCEGEAEASKVLYELKKHIQHSVSYQAASFDVDASIGFAMFPKQGTGFDELYNKADAAMYYAKNHNVDAPVLYEDSMEGIRK